MPSYSVSRFRQLIAFPLFFLLSVRSRRKLKLAILSVASFSLFCLVFFFVPGLSSEHVLLTEDNTPPLVKRIVEDPSVFEDPVPIDIDCPGPEVYHSLQHDVTFDVLIPWVNDSDPNWIAKKALFSDDPHGGKAFRFSDHGELRYCIRSMEKYLRGFRHIYLLTDDQVPSWLDTSDPRIKIVTHKQIVPRHLHDEILPFFNSQAFEAFFWNIPGISDNFLYMNDDLFFGDTTDLSYFLDAGKVVVYHEPHLIMQNKAVKRPYIIMMRKLIDVLFTSWGAEPLQGFKFHSHTPKIINKKLFKYIYDKFEDKFMIAARTRFRGPPIMDPMNTFLFSISILSNLETCHDVALPRRGFITYTSLNNSLKKTEYQLNLIRSLKPPFYNINDDLDETKDPNNEIIPKAVEMYINLMNELYPEPSEFELF
ncbi:hypothetical protein RCL1_005732 [Eukaryota sp. TZLM3-RCL]